MSKRTSLLEELCMRQKELDNIFDSAFAGRHPSDESHPIDAKSMLFLAKKALRNIVKWAVDAAEESMAKKKVDVSDPKARKLVDVQSTLNHVVTLLQSDGLKCRFLALISECEVDGPDVERKQHERASSTPMSAFKLSSSKPLNNDLGHAREERSGEERRDEERSGEGRGEEGRGGQRGTEAVEGADRGGESGWVGSRSVSETWGRETRALEVSGLSALSGMSGVSGAEWERERRGLLCVALSAFAKVEMANGNLHFAQKLVESALVWQKSRGGSPNSLISLQLNMVALLSAAGQHRKAHSLAQACAARLTAVLRLDAAAESPPFSSESVFLLSCAYFNAAVEAEHIRDMAQALDLYRAALAVADNFKQRQCQSVSDGHDSESAARPSEDTNVFLTKATCIIADAKAAITSLESTKVRSRPRTAGSTSNGVGSRGPTRPLGTSLNRNKDALEVVRIRPPDAQVELHDTIESCSDTSP